MRIRTASSPRRISEARGPAGGPGLGLKGVRDVRKTILPLLAVVFVLGPQTGASESELSGSLQLLKDLRPGPEGSQEPWYPYGTESWLTAVGGTLLGASASGARDTPRRPECTITGTDGADRLVGTDGPDVICARGGNDQVHAHGGDDVIFLGPGRDTFTAGAGDDRVFTGRGDDHYGDGGRGNDRIYLQGGDDLVEDYLGADLLSGGSGRDWLCNGDGKGNDRLIGGPGRDHASADDGDTVLSVEVEGPCFY